MANKHSAAIKTYLNNIYGSDNIKYESDYFMRGVKQKDGTIAYYICEQSMNDNDSKYDSGRPNFLPMPKALTEDEAKKIISSLSLDENGIVN